MYVRNTRRIGLSGLGEEPSWLDKVGSGLTNALTIGALTFSNITQQKLQADQNIAAIKMTQAQALANQTAAQKYSMMNMLSQSQAIVPIVLGIGAIGAFFYFNKR